MKVGEAIISLRNRKQIGRRDLAQAIGIYPRQLRLIERNEKKPTVKNMADIAKYFDLPPSAIFFLALEYNDIENEEQKKYFEAAKPIVDKLIEYLLSDKP